MKEKEWLLRDKYNGIETEEFKSDLKKLEDGEPLAYLIGWTPFLNTRIYLDSKPLIPRPETEYWVSKAIEEIRKVESPTILDLCAGSGCIGVSVLKEIPDSKVDFVEIDPMHHDTIKKNIIENDIDISRTNIFEGDLFQNIKGEYDFILSNPPYIDKDLNRIDKSIMENEPSIALYGGKDGIEIIERILKESPKYLKLGGTLYIEHEPEQVSRLNGLTHHKDQFGVKRFSTLKPVREK